MKKYFIMSLLTLWTSHLFAASVTTVRIHPDNELVVSGTTASNFTINSAEPSGDGTSDTAPAKVYIPMDGPLAEPDYFTQPGVTQLFTAAGAAYTVNIPLYINSTASNYYLYIGIKVTNTGTNDYKIVQVHPSSPFNDVTNRSETFSISPKLICDQTADCGNFASATSETQHLAYFFLSTTDPTGLPPGQTFSPATYPGGMYFEVNMSNRIYASTQVLPAISKIRPGDKRAIIEYTSNASILKPKALRVYNHGSSAPGPVNQPIQSYFGTGDLLAESYNYAASGEVVVTNLANGGTYYLSILLVDLYGFGTVLSDDALAQPLQIEELLKKEACFLLTAGFGEDHYVIDYFRHFRDDVLAKTLLGKAFISVYYEYGPKYALMLYKHDSLRAVVRAGAYALYFIFNYFFLVAIFGALITAIYLHKNKEKIKI